MRRQPKLGRQRLTVCGDLQYHPQMQACGDGAGSRPAPWQPLCAVPNAGEGSDRTAVGPRCILYYRCHHLQDSVHRATTASECKPWPGVKLTGVHNGRSRSMTRQDFCQVVRWNLKIIGWKVTFRPVCHRLRCGVQSVALWGWHSCVYRRVSRLYHARLLLTAAHPTPDIQLDPVY